MARAMYSALMGWIVSSTTILRTPPAGVEGRSAADSRGGCPHREKRNATKHAVHAVRMTAETRFIAPFAPLRLRAMTRRAANARVLRLLSLDFANSATDSVDAVVLWKISLPRPDP